MVLALHNLHPKKGSKKTKKRIGRGLASKGAKSGRGQKGQKSRSGVSGLKKLGLRREMLAAPKLRGFTSPNKKKEVVNVSDLSQFDGEITPAVLKEKGLVKTVRYGVKVLGNGNVDKAVTVKGCDVSKTAAEKITAAGGTILAK